jgi:hypothetical protein
LADYSTAKTDFALACALDSAAQAASATGGSDGELGSSTFSSAISSPFFGFLADGAASVFFPDLQELLSTACTEAKKILARAMQIFIGSVHITIPSGCFRNRASIEHANVAGAAQVIRSSRSKDGYD